MFIIFTISASLLVISPVCHSLQFTYSQSIPYVIEVGDEILTNNSFDADENEIQVVTENCTRALEIFSEKVASLTRCIVLNARPIRVCTKCDKEMNATKIAYNKLQKELPTCHEFYFESDQTRIVELVYTQGTDLWSKNNCQNCYHDYNKTEMFFNASKNLHSCMKHFNVTPTKEFNNTCDMCHEFFVIMYNIYKEFLQEINNDENSGVCMDIVDQMNVTHHIWNSLNCLKFDSRIGAPIIVTALLVGFIPILFYIISKNISIIEDIKLVRPKRKSYSSLQSESVPAE